MGEGAIRGAILRWLAGHWRYFSPLTRWSCSSRTTPCAEKICA